MGIADTLLPEFDREMAMTLEMLDRIPDDKLDWSPHEKSMTLGRLIDHLSHLPRWAVIAIEEERFDIAPPDEEPSQLAGIESIGEVMEMFATHVPNARDAIERATDEHLLAPWTLLSGGEVVFTMPRVSVLRNMVLNHLIHHRAQLGVYLRMNEIAVPATYGPSADEDE